MLQDMQAKAKKEKANEEIAFAEFETWCKMEIPQTKKAIATGAETIELLQSSIDKLTTEAEMLGKEIEKLQNEVANAAAEKKAADAQRAKDHAAFVAESTDYGESLDALDRALVVMQKVNSNVPGTADSAVLLQLTSSESHLPAQAKTMVAAFMGMMGKDFMSDMQGQDPLGGMDYEAPEANAYDFQSGGIIAMLKKLRDEFRGKLGDCQKEEMNSKHADDMVVTDLNDLMENGEDTIAQKKETKAMKEEQAASDKKDLAATIETKKADEQTLKEMEVECKEKQFSYDEKQQLRTEEIEAIGQAIKILQSPETLGNAEKYLDLAQTSQKTSFAVLRGQDALEGVRGRVRDFLASEGHRLRSKGLALLAQKLEADPFAKVKKLIDDMITRLLNEANEDAQHEGFCDKEIGKSKVTRNKLQEDT